MTTIASPRPSISVRSPSASSRTSLDVPTGRPTNARRNRAALRDYYGIKNTAAQENSAPPSELDFGIEESEAGELDKESFDAQAYVRDVLANKGLEGVLKVEAGLLSEIRGLDGERKALVYDNYSKLIAATDTIRKMRTNMDPLIPTISTLSPAISHIAETATSLSAAITDHTPTPSIVTENTDAPANALEGSKKNSAQQTVRWVLEAPRRLRELVAEGKTKEAEADWQEVRRLLEKWKDVEGVQQVKEECEAAMEGANT